MDAVAETAARGDKTRDALIRAAIEAFGREGFAAASTRAIAETAGVNQALIGYHFGGKPGLYAAALGQIAAVVRQRMTPIIAEIDAAVGLGPVFDTEAGSENTVTSQPSEATPADCIAALHRLLDAFIAMVTSEESAPWARLILREQQDPTPSFDILYAGIMHPLLTVATVLIGRIRNEDPTAANVRLMAITVLAQALIFRMARAAVTRQMAWSTIGAAEVREIQDRVRRNTTSIVTQEVSN
jgi:AcrR family transcriptional regulator